jgi:hypothetical protein
LKTPGVEARRFSAVDLLSDLLGQSAPIGIIAATPTRSASGEKQDGDQNAESFHGTFSNVIPRALSQADALVARKMIVWPCLSRMQSTGTVDGFGANIARIAAMIVTEPPARPGPGRRSPS